MTNTKTMKAIVQMTQSFTGTMAKNWRIHFHTTSLKMSLVRNNLAFIKCIRKPRLNELINSLNFGFKYQSCINLDEPEAEVLNDRGDSVYNYSRCMLWRGLLHMVQTYAERCNNGDHLITDWRLDMVEFWNYNHNKYLILGHRLLAGNQRFKDLYLFFN